LVLFFKKEHSSFPSDSRIMKLTVFQGPIAAGDTLAVLDRAAAEAGEGLLILPELFLTGYNIGADALRALAEPADGPSAQAAAAIARRHGVALLYGYPERGADGFLYNSALLIARDGRACANYRKLQLFGAMEHAAFTAGDDPCVLAEIDGVKLGILICYDVEFPELVRGLALRGADLVAVPTAQMQPYEFVPRVLIPSRAYENSVFVAYANRCGVEGDLVYTGESCIVGPDGHDLARAGRGEEAIFATLDLAALAKARVLNTYLADRRPALYGALVEAPR
jgi:predicted amidohydrolase